jgi:hypothetical protein
VSTNEEAHAETDARKEAQHTRTADSLEPASGSKGTGKKALKEGTSASVSQEKTVATTGEKR